jgi:hypothetical protein
LGIYKGGKQKEQSSWRARLDIPSSRTESTYRNKKRADLGVGEEGPNNEQMQYDVFQQE